MMYKISVACYRDLGPNSIPNNGIETILHENKYINLKCNYDRCTWGNKAFAAYKYDISDVLQHMNEQNLTNEILTIWCDGKFCSPKGNKIYKKDCENSFKIWIENLMKILF